MRNKIVLTCLLSVCSIFSVAAYASGHVHMEEARYGDVEVSVPSEIAADSMVIFLLKKHLQDAYGEKALSWKYAIDSVAQTVDVYEPSQKSWVTLTFSTIGVSSTSHSRRAP